MARHNSAPSYLNVARAREYVDAFHPWDVDALRDFYAGDVMWQSAESPPECGDSRGKESLFNRGGPPSATQAPWAAGRQCT